MRFLLAGLYLYGLFIVQAGILPVGPDFLLLALIVFALHEEKLPSTLLGLFAGLCLDLTAPSHLGVNMFVLSVIGYGVSSIRPLFYRARWHIVIMTVVGLGLKQTIRLITGNGLPQVAPLIVSLVLTLILSPFAEYLVNPLFYPDNFRWQRPQWKSD
ncbi:MAG: rod shape-determining protein MreD [candidate division WOR-3 bacterium]